MTIPPWLTFLVAAVVGLFGAFRLRLALRSRADEAKARQSRGLYALPRRTHLLFGLLYLILAGFLVAAGLGWVHSPFASAPAADDSAPTTNTIIIEPPSE